MRLAASYSYLLVWYLQVPEHVLWHVPEQVVLHPPWQHVEQPVQSAAQESLQARGQLILDVFDACAKICTFANATAPTTGRTALAAFLKNSLLDWISSFLFSSFISFSLSYIPLSPSVLNVNFLKMHIIFLDRKFTTIPKPICIPTVITIHKSVTTIHWLSVSFSTTQRLSTRLRHSSP